MNGISRISAKNVNQSSVNEDMKPQFSIRSGAWSELKHYAMPIREDVFIQEQFINPEDEWDALDEVSTHFVVFDDEKQIATARLLENHSIGRVAVLKSYRGLGIGHDLMKFIIEFAKHENRPKLILSAQVHAIPFYHHLGFEIQGDEYLDCGIPHITMLMVL